MSIEFILKSDKKNKYQFNISNNEEKLIINVKSLNKRYSTIYETKKI